MNTQTNLTGWEGSYKVNGLEPKLGFREAIIGCMVDNDFIDSANQMQAIDDWHYLVAGEMRLWKNKEDFLANKLNTALEETGWNVVVKVQFATNDDASFIVDLSEHGFQPYYMLVYYNGHYKYFEQNVDVTRDKDKQYLQLIPVIFNLTSDGEERIERITNLFDEDFLRDDWSGDEYTIVDLRPQLLLKDGVIATNLCDELSYIEFPNSNDYEDEDEYVEARDEFESNLQDEGLYIYSLCFI